MALTKEEKDKKRALKIAAERESEQNRIQQQKEHYAAYLATVPKRLMNLVALADWVGVSAAVCLIETGAKVRFYANDEANNIYIDTVMTYDVEEWKLEQLEFELATMKKKLDDQAARLRFATEVFNKLSVDEKLAIKENIHRLQ